MKQSIERARVALRRLSNRVDVQSIVLQHVGNAKLGNNGDCLGSLEDTDQPHKVNHWILGTHDPVPLRRLRERLCTALIAAAWRRTSARPPSSARARDRV